MVTFNLRINAKSLHFSILFRVQSNVEMDIVFVNKRNISLKNWCRSEKKERWTKDLNHSEIWKTIKKNDFKSFDDLEKKNSFFTERTISLNELFYWTNDFTKRSFNEKTNEIYGKSAIILRTNELDIFWAIEKRLSRIKVRLIWRLPKRSSPELKKYIC